MFAGRMRGKVTFLERVSVSDGAGNEQGNFADVFTTRAELVPVRGNETVIAARLEGVQPFYLNVRSFAMTRLVTTDWAVRDERNGKVYAIKSIGDQTQKRHELSMMVVEGVAP